MFSAAGKPAAACPLQLGVVVVREQLGSAMPAPSFQVLCGYMHPFGLARRLKHRRPATAPTGLRHENRTAPVGRDRRDT